MSEKRTLTLPDSLERLEIEPRRPESDAEDLEKIKRKKQDDGIKPEAVLESLSLSGAECPYGSCHCNRRRNQEGNILNKTSFKRPILQRSRLGCFSRKVLRDPVLRLKENKSDVNSSDLKIIGLHSDTLNRIPVDLGKCSGKVLGSDQPSEPTDFKCLIANHNSDDNDASTTVYDGPSYVELRARKEKINTGPVKRRGAKMCVKCSDIGLVSDNRLPSKTQNSSSCSLQARITTATQPLQCDDTTTDELAEYFDLFVHIPKKMSHMAEMMYI